MAMSSSRPKCSLPMPSSHRSRSIPSSHLPPDYVQFLNSSSRSPQYSRCWWGGLLAAVGGAEIPGHECAPISGADPSSAGPAAGAQREHVGQGAEGEKLMSSREVRARASSRIGLSNRAYFSDVDAVGVQPQIWCRSDHERSSLRGGHGPLPPWPHPPQQYDQIRHQDRYPCHQVPQHRRLGCLARRCPGYVGGAAPGFHSTESSQAQLALELRMQAIEAHRTGTNPPRLPASELARVILVDLRGAGDDSQQDRDPEPDRSSRFQWSAPCDDRAELSVRPGCRWAF